MEAIPESEIGKMTVAEYEISRLSKYAPEPILTETFRC